MRHISIIERGTGKRLAFLQNAYQIGYKLEMNKIWSAHFTLPYDDPKNRYCQPLNYLEIYDGEEYVGLFRIIPSRMKRDASTQEITYECEHVIATLMDDLLVKWHEVGNVGVYTNQSINYVLQRQTVKNWVLGDCEFQHQFLYGWENENLLTALFSIPNIFSERYRWEFDTQQYPWTLHLRRNPIEEVVQKDVYNSATGQTERFIVTRHNAVAEIRYRKNMRGIEKTLDASTIVTRLYAFGYGEGDNQLNISKVNPSGELYIDADTQSKYGIISQVWVDRRYQYDETLYQAARKKLESLKEPKVSYTIQTAYIDHLKKCRIGDIIRVIDDDDDLDLYLPLESIEKADMLGAPNDAKLMFGSLQENAAGTVADLFDRQRIEETYSQGAVTLFSQSFQDNAAAEFPAELRFFIPENAVHINQIILQGRFSSFRGYSKATKGGGATSETTKNGGASTQTSTSGGASTATSESGGASTVTSTSGGGSTVTSASGGGGSATSAGGGGFSDKSVGEASIDVEDANTGTAAPNSHSHSYKRPEYGENEYGYGGYGWHTHTFSAEAHTHGVAIPAHSHSVSVPSHSHSVSVPGHNHSVRIPGHTHNVSIPAHAHSFSIPNHTHEIEYGIYRGTTARTGTLTVDGEKVGTFSGFNNLNLIPYLSTDGNGLVQRGWHTLQITPDTLTRIELDLVIQLFANSRGGGQY